MNKGFFTPKTLAEFYASAPNDDAIPQFLAHPDCWAERPRGPSISSYIGDWRWPPQDKVIDLSLLVGSDVLCVFWDEGHIVSAGFDNLSAIHDGIDYIQALDLTPWDRCTPALGIWQACDGKLPKLPEGLDVTVRRAYVDEITYDLGFIEESIEHIETEEGVVAFRVNGKLEGYKWPWE